jgi:hypothetical protein
MDQQPSDRSINPYLPTRQGRRESPVAPHQTDNDVVNNNASQQQQIIIPAPISEEMVADDLFDSIEALICEYMREPHRHHSHYRNLQWSLHDNSSRLSTVAVVINFPTHINELFHLMRTDR